jgi:hypothetical protein
MKLLIAQFSPTSCHFVSLTGRKIKNMDNLENMVFYRASEGGMSEMRD